MGIVRPVPFWPKYLLNLGLIGFQGTNCSFTIIHFHTKSAWTLRLVFRAGFPGQQATQTSPNREVCRQPCRYIDVGPMHCTDIIMGAIGSQITSLTIVYSTLYSDADQRKHQSSASLALVGGIHRGPVNSLHKWPVTWKMFPFDDIIMVS